MPLCGPDGSVLGNSVIVANAAALPTGAARYPGVRAYQADTQQTKEWDGSGWVIMSEPTQSYAPTITSGTGAITTVGAVTFTYRRADGWLFWEASITITTTGSAGGPLLCTFPIAPFAASGGYLGGFRESAVGGLTGSCFASAPNIGMLLYNNAYPGGSGYTVKAGGHYRMTTRYS